MQLQSFSLLDTYTGTSASTIMMSIRLLDISSIYVQYFMPTNITVLFKYNVMLLRQYNLLHHLR